MRSRSGPHKCHVPEPHGQAHGPTRKRSEHAIEKSSGPGVKHEARGWMSSQGLQYQMVGMSIVEYRRSSNTGVHSPGIEEVRTLGYLRWHFKALI